MNLFHDLERRIDERLRKLLQSEPAPAQGRELVEIERMILDRISDRVQNLPRARRVFPFNDVTVRLPVPDPDRRAAYEMVFVHDDALDHEIKEHLRREGAEYPRDLTVQVSLLDTAEISEPALLCRTREKAATQPAVQPPRVRFTPPAGEPVEISKLRVQVGRTAEVLDDRGRLVRRNDVVFDDSTVSRAHAHLEFRDGELRLFDDGSSYGTSVIHDGRLFDVPKAGARGLKLDTGDEIYFGQLRVRLDVAS